MRELNVEATITKHASNGTDIHLFLLFDLSNDISLDFLQQAGIMVGCITGARFEGVFDPLVADCAATPRLFLYVEEDV